MSKCERYVIIMLVVSLVLRGGAVAQERISQVLVYMVATTTHKSPLVFHYLGFGCVDPLPL